MAAAKQQGGASYGCRRSCRDVLQLLHLNERGRDAPGKRSRVSKLLAQSGRKEERTCSAYVDGTSSCRARPVDTLSSRNRNCEQKSKRQPSREESRTKTHHA